MKMPRTAVVVILAGLALMIPAALGLRGNGPNTLSPLPALTTWSALLLAYLHIWQVAMLFPTLCFFLWSPGLFHGETRTPKRSYVLLAALSISSVAWFVSGWQYGLDYQGARYTSIVAIINVVFVTFLIAAFFRNWSRGPSFKRNLILHWVLFAWLAWYAFPWLGEML